MATVLNESSLKVFEELRLACEAADAMARPVITRIGMDRLGFHVVSILGDKRAHRHFPWFDIMLARHNKLLEAVQQTAEEVRRAALT